MVVSRMVRVFGVMLALSVVIGCSSSSSGDDDDDTANTGDTKPQPPYKEDLTIAFNPMYSAYIDADHPCKIPAIITGVMGGVKWYASDDSMVKLEEDSTGGVLITTKKPGEVEILATAGPLSGHAKLTISSFTAAEYEAGNARYNSDVKYTAPTMADISRIIMEMMADGGMPNFQKIFAEIGPPDGAACTNCHGEGAAMLSVQHTSQQIGGYSDDDLIKIITMGIKPPGAKMVSQLPPQLYQMFHTWDAASMTDEQTHGILAYLRSLEPKAQGGTIDFMGAGMMNAGGPPMN